MGRKRRVPAGPLRLALAPVTTSAGKLMIVKNLQSFYNSKNENIFHLERFIWNLLHNIPKGI
jgi:hypothetical protein